MIGYYILGGILFLFCLGVTSIICDALFNKEEEIVLVHRKPPEENFANFIADKYSDDYDYDDVNDGLGF